MQQYTTLILIALMVVAFYFLIMRPQKKRQQAAQRTINESQPGTRVMLGSGVFGTIVAVGDRQIVLEIAPGVELTVLKQAISRVVTDEDEDTEFLESNDLDNYPMVTEYSEILSADAYEDEFEESLEDLLDRLAQLHS